MCSQGAPTGAKVPMGRRVAPQQICCTVSTAVCATPHKRVSQYLCVSPERRDDEDASCPADLKDDRNHHTPDCSLASPPSRMRSCEVTESLVC
eukprot:2391436-Prymnesium_polylepis.2